MTRHSKTFPADPEPDRVLPDTRRPPAGGENPVYASRQLFGTATEIGIEHDGYFYRLKITKQGKLILNK